MESNCIENGKVKRAKNTFTIGKCCPCLSKIGHFCCSQLTSRTTIISQKKKGLNLKSIVKSTSKVVCYLFDKKYEEKAKTAFNIKIEQSQKRYQKLKRHL